MLYQAAIIVSSVATVVYVPHSTHVGFQQQPEHQWASLLTTHALLRCQLCCPLSIACRLLEDMRDMLTWLLSAQEPDTTEHQAANSTRKYVCNGCSWQLVQDQAAGAAGVAAEASEQEEDEEGEEKEQQEVEGALAAAT